MKKVLSTLLAVCLVLTAIPVVRSGAVGNELLREDFENAVLETYNGQVPTLESCIKTDGNKWYAIATSDNWVEPTVENSTMTIANNNRGVKVSKYFGVGSLAKNGDEFVVTVKAKATAASGLYVGIRNCDSSDESADWAHPRIDFTVQKSDDFAAYLQKTG